MTNAGVQEDVDVMLRLKAGDDQALNQLMDKWQQPLVHFLVRMTNNHRDAMDLAQETFVRLYQSRCSYRSSGKFSTFLFTIATRLARNRARWRSRHPEVCIDTHSEAEEFDAPYNPIDHLQAAGDNPSDGLQRKERVQEIRQVVQQLPVDMRECLVLFEYHGMSYADIAAVSNCSVKAVENRIYRARKMLKSQLMPE